MGACSCLQLERRTSCCCAVLRSCRNEHPFRGFVSVRSAWFSISLHALSNAMPHGGSTSITQSVQLKVAAMVWYMP
jgi:hypothetical protein